jgi:hypothetical protein
MGQAVSPWMPGDEVQEQGISVGRRFFELRKALHVVRSETESGETLMALANIMPVFYVLYKQIIDAVVVFVPES